jgi:hypothetical protein
MPAVLDGFLELDAGLDRSPQRTRLCDPLQRSSCSPLRSPLSSIATLNRRGVERWS